MAVDNACSKFQPPTKFEVRRWHTFGFIINRPGDLFTSNLGVRVNYYLWGTGHLLTNYGVLGSHFSFSVYGPTPCQTEHVTLRPSPLTFELMALVGDNGSSCFICVPSLTFAGLSVRKIWHTFISVVSQCINPHAWWPWPSTFWPWNCCALLYITPGLHGFVIYFICITFTFASTCV